jgi:microcystin-dependent protein
VPPSQLATTSQSGTINQLSGNSADYLGGDNAFHALATALADLLMPTGAIIDFGGSAAPTGFLLCNGTAISRTTYSALFNVIGTTYGTGDGSTTFNLPDLRGRVAVGLGQGAGLTNRVLAAKGGEETHVLSVGELATHAHAVSDPTHVHAVASSPSLINYGYGGGANFYQCASTGIATDARYANITISNNGSSAGHNTMQPFAVLNKIIKI